MWCTLDYGNGQERVKSFAVYPSSATKHNRTWRMLGWPCEIWYISISLNTLPLECPTHLSMILTANSWSFKKVSKMVTHYMYAVFGEFLSPDAQFFYPPFGIQQIEKYTNHSYDLWRTSPVMLLIQVLTEP